MQIITAFEQGSKEWLEMRLGKITATDCPAIMGNSPFVTPLDIYNLKHGLKEPPAENDAMRRGKELEPIARQLLIEETGLVFEPLVCLHDTESWAMSSLDGYNEDNRIIAEIKSPTKITNHQMAVDGIIPEYYVDQCFWQLYCTGAKTLYFCSYHPDSPVPLALVERTPDKEYIKNMVETCKRFYFDNLCQFRPPEPKTLKMR